MNNSTDTIFALSTPQGKSAIAVFRISGDNSYEIIKKISSKIPKKPNVAFFNSIMTDDKKIIDQTVTVFYKSPKSFTGQDMVEISVHGSNAVIKKIHQTLLKQGGIRMALPGEFTRRAFENNKLDLTQVEAIADIVNAETEMQRKQAVNHLTGNFFKSTKKIFEDLKKVLANIEAVIDFTEEDLPKNLYEKIKEQIKNIIIKIKIITDNSSVGISIRDGFTVLILGKPNTGKSSFINAISDREVAIVTNQPGTTRDLIESFVDIDGYPIKFIDTAGIRNSKNIVEKIGVEKAIDASKSSSINIVFIEDAEDIKNFGFISNAIFVKSKQDLNGEGFLEKNYYNISSNTKFGINDLLNIIIEKIQKKTPGEKSYISRERHLICLKNVIFNLEASKNEKSIDLFAEDIRQAVKQFSSLFGVVDIEDVLEIIFNDFCVGKWFHVK